MKPLNVTGQRWPGIRYFSTTRHGGVSLAPYDSNNLGLHVNDDPQAVQQNRERLRALLPGEPVWLNQVHGTSVLDADSEPDPAGSGATAPFDASMTVTPGRVLAILTADCLPVVLASNTSDDGVKGIAAAHAGWRGLAAGVLENTVKKLHIACGKLPDYAWIGPAISYQVFEIGPQVREAFLDVDPTVAGCFMPHPVNAGKWLADLSGIAAHRLTALGVRQVEQSGLCTYRQDDLFYSYRRNPTTGRLATLIWIER
ncbi:peptidoglycan editing factor PgeF [Advenella mimigardefordensis]|uniref:Purine nucleoside phosphorylase n=1 Tax=Advenella mimigardefordensis (strain DSM 17166 / LMG 22922 / DPN7) TaxID=1247726 RepID=W0P9B6_ADVMD|nr:peptidoglycan editing factor PgeF [Advenella mimigardefordensis]AHG63444.1 putative oxidoreductase [Advenella mimigardefordensis DPN7]